MRVSADQVAGVSWRQRMWRWLGRLYWREVSSMDWMRGKDGETRRKR